MYYDTYQQQRTENTNKTVSFSTSVQAKHLSCQPYSHWLVPWSQCHRGTMYPLLLKTDLFGFFNCFILWRCLKVPITSSIIFPWNKIWIFLRQVLQKFFYLLEIPISYGLRKVAKYDNFCYDRAARGRVVFLAWCKTNLHSRLLRIFELQSRLWSQTRNRPMPLKAWS